MKTYNKKLKENLNMKTLNKKKFKKNISGTCLISKLYDKSKKAIKI
jgi:hypothetical protein